jgi:hypothetical protein
MNKINANNIEEVIVDHHSYPDDCILLQLKLKYPDDTIKYIPIDTNAAGIKKLIADGYDREVKDSKEKEEDDATAVPENNKGYEYLLRLNVRNFTAEKVENLKKDLAAIKEHLQEIEKTDAKTMWLNDLREFETEYAKWTTIMNK